MKITYELYEVLIISYVFSCKTIVFVLRMEEENLVGMVRKIVKQN